MSDNGLKRRRVLVGVSIFLAAAALLSLVLVSPMAMRYLATDSFDWVELSNVGQAYGGTSAILSALAFAAIAVSLILQWKQNRITILTALRERHFDLVMFSLENPELPVAIGQTANLTSPRLAIYANLNLTHWFMEWQLDLLSDQEVMRRCRVHLFANPDVRQWWDLTGSTWADPTEKHGRRFMKLVNTSFEQASEDALAQSSLDSNNRSADSGSPSSREASTQTRRESRTTLVVGLAAATVSSMITIAATAHYRRRR